MTSADTGDPAAVAVALEQIRGTMATGFASIDGKLALLAQRGEQTERRLDDLDRRLDAVERGETDRQKRAESRLSALESSRWPLRTIGALSGVVAAVAAVAGVAVYH